MVFRGRLCRGWGSFALVPNATSSWHAVARSSTTEPQTGASAPSFDDSTQPACPILDPSPS